MKTKARVLVVLEHDGRVAVYGNPEEIAVRVVSKPKPHSSDSQADRCAEEFMESRIPLCWRDLFWPGGSFELAVGYLETRTVGGIKTDTLAEDWLVKLSDLCDRLVASGVIQEAATSIHSEDLP